VENIDAPEIFLVTTLQPDGAARCVGWFRTMDEAVEIVMGNYGDICEAFYYRWAVIEPQGPGLYGCDGAGDEVERSRWFEFTPGEPDKETGREGVVVKPIDRPDKYARTCNFGIG
jgi:hypothetical protein